jgi:hypothetical protein
MKGSYSLCRDNLLSMSNVDTNQPLPTCVKIFVCHKESITRPRDAQQKTLYVFCTCFRASNRKNDDPPPINIPHC